MALSSNRLDAENVATVSTLCDLAQSVFNPPAARFPLLSRMCEIQVQVEPPET